MKAPIVIFSWLAFAMFSGFLMGIGTANGIWRDHIIEKNAGGYDRLGVFVVYGQPDEISTNPIEETK